MLWGNTPFFKRILPALILFILLTSGLIYVMRGTLFPQSLTTIRVAPTEMPTEMPTEIPTEISTETAPASEPAFPEPNTHAASEPGDGEPADSSYEESSSQENNSQENNSEESNIVVIVNGLPIVQQQWDQAYSVDGFMTEWLQSPQPADDIATLEQLINRALVLSAATADDVLPAVSSAAEADPATRQQLLNLLDVDSPEDPRLIAQLQAYDLAFEVLDQHFGELLRVDRLSRLQAQEQSQSVEEYLRTLQTAARISYGAVAQDRQISFNLPQPPQSIAQVDESVAIATDSERANGENGEFVEEATRAHDPDVVPTPADAMPTEGETPPPATTPQATPTFGTRPGLHAPRFELETINLETDTPGIETLTSAVFEGAPTLLSFWTSWCPYCRAQTPALNEAYDEYTPRGVQFVGINVREQRPTVENYIREHAIPFINGLDVHGEAALAYEIHGFPTTYFIDSTGKIHARHIGRLSVEQIDEYLIALITHEATLDALRAD